MRLASPVDLQGDPEVIRLSVSRLDRREDQCRDFAALSARPHVWPTKRSARRYPPLEEFPLGAVMAVLDNLEFGGMDPEQAVSDALTEACPPLHPGVAAWVKQAYQRYMDAADEIASELARLGVVLAPERNPRLVQFGDRTGGYRALTAWGRWYASADGTVRELRLLRLTRQGDPEAVSTLAAAFVVTAGARATGNIYREVPVPTRPEDAEATRIRVVEVVIGKDLGHRVLIDAPPDEVRDRYRARAMPAAQELLQGGSRVPGQDCLSCKLLEVCDAVPRVPGLLDVHTAGSHRRAWSVTTARRYLTCAGQAHFGDLKLTGHRDDDTPASRQGRLVHEWLRVVHLRRPTRACSIDDIPDGGSDLMGLTEPAMSEADYQQARPHLVAHLDVCPLRQSTERVDVESRIVVHDPAADVLVVAAPDLLIWTKEGVVYREVKTGASALDVSGLRLLERFPQLSLAVGLLTSGAISSGLTAGVELEFLTPEGASLYRFDVADPSVRAVARRVVAAMVRDWHKDQEFTTTPGWWCATCPASRWCPDSTDVTPHEFTIDGVVIDPGTGEVLPEKSIKPVVETAATAAGDGSTSQKAENEEPHHA